MEMSEDDDELGSLDTFFIGGKGSRLINSELVGGTMSVGGDGSVLTDKMFIGGAEFLLTTSLVSLMTHGSAPRVDQPLSISLGKFDGIGTGMNSRGQSGQHRVYMYSKGRTLNMYPQLCSLLFLDFWLFFLYCDRMKSVIHT